MSTIASPEYEKTRDFMKTPPICSKFDGTAFSAMAPSESGQHSPPIDPIFGSGIAIMSPARIPGRSTSSFLSGSAGTAIFFSAAPKSSGGVAGLPHMCPLLAVLILRRIAVGKAAIKAMLDVRGRCDPPVEGTFRF